MEVAFEDPSRVSDLHGHPQEDPSMPLTRSQPLALTLRAARRARAAGPSCRGGASSLLRVGQPMQTFAPAARAWTQRLAFASTFDPEAA
jgi:hypothetical protein